MAKLAKNENGLHFIDFPRNKTIELTRSSHQLHSGLPKMHSVHVLYCLQSGSVEPREKDKPHLNKDTKK